MASAEVMTMMAPPTPTTAAVESSMAVAPTNTADRKRKRSRAEKWDSYLHKMLNRVQEGKEHKTKVTMSRRSMKVMNTLVDALLSLFMDAMRNLRLSSRKATLHEHDIICACHLILKPDMTNTDLHDNAIANAKQALIWYGETSTPSVKKPASPSKDGQSKGELKSAHEGEHKGEAQNDDKAQSKEVKSKKASKPMRAKATMMKKRSISARSPSGKSKKVTTDKKKPATMVNQPEQGDEASSKTSKKASSKSSTKMANEPTKAKAEPAVKSSGKAKGKKSVKN